MADSASTPKKLKDLRVTDLKSELERRGLATSGVKAVLADRLSKHLVEEGHDPKDFTFDLGAPKTTPAPAAEEPEAAEPAEDKPMEEDDGATKADEDAKDSVKVEEEEKTTEQEEVKGKVEEEKSEEVKDNADEEKMEEEEVKPVAEDVKANDEEVEVKANEEEATEDKKDSDEQPKGEEANKDEDQANEKTVENSHGDDGDSITLNLGEDEADHMFAEETNVQAASPPRPETAPVVRPFTSRDTISLSSRGGKAPSDNSSTLVHIDESESVCTQGSAEGDKKDEESKENGEKAKEGDKKEEAKKSSSGRNLWVSGLASSTRATDLKALFSKHGKVVGAKVVTNARTPGARCYGYVTMGSPDDASKCMQHLHQTELHGRMISVEKAKGDSTGPSKKASDSAVAPASAGQQPADTKKDDHKPTDHRRSSDRNRSRSHHRSTRSRERGPHAHGGHNSSHRPSRDVSPRREDRATRPGVLTFQQIRDERLRQKDREEERRRRERERRRLDDEDRRRRESERRRREEEDKIARERDALRREREKLEREKAEILKFERERQRLERERLEREKEELERLRRAQQSRLEEVRRGTKRSVVDDPYSSTTYDDRKRMSGGSSRDYERSSTRDYSGSSSRQTGYSGGSRDYRSDRDHRSGGSRSDRYGSSSSGVWASGSTSGMGIAGGAVGASSSDWSRGSAIPRPPMIGGSMAMMQQFGSGAPSSFQGGYSNSDRFDAYKNPMLNKRY